MGYKFTLVLSREITDDESAILQEAGCAGAIFGPDTLPTNADVPVTKMDFDTTAAPGLAEAIESALEAVKKVPDLSVPGLTVPAQPAHAEAETHAESNGHAETHAVSNGHAESNGNGNGHAASNGNGNGNGHVAESDSVIDGIVIEEPAAARKARVRKPVARKPAAKKAGSNGHPAPVEAGAGSA